MRQPPMLASALLRLIAQPDDGAVGDLAEQFHAGRTPAWYWRQVFGVIVQAMLRDVRHSWPFVVGVVICGMVLTAFGPLLTAAIQTFPEQLFMRGLEWFYVNQYRLPSVILDHPWLITLGVYAVIGWIVGRVAGRRHAVIVFAFAASVFAGGMVAPMTQFGFSYPMLSFHFRFAFHPVPFGRILTQHFVVNDHVDFMNVFVFNGVLLPLVTFMAGLLARRHRSDARGMVA